MERCVSRSVCHENFLALAATSLVIGVSSGVLCADFRRPLKAPIDCLENIGQGLVDGTTYNLFDTLRTGVKSA